ncbi:MULTISPECIES: hypothetical protein [Cysteiniphilum]|uniref:Uncharacterized protein n=1 Tax=Cysteiniphilum litorale TaxID=2056700 RepID=A0A8J2Z2M3_9GAMM|nr:MULTISPECIES: hypothetical protein [Cysteiniphilum]GGF91492.1 hypothetical protein GCM10010995_05890 [Cysteiniphilum litorale]
MKQGNDREITNVHLGYEKIGSHIYDLLSADKVQMTKQMDKAGLFQGNGFLVSFEGNAIFNEVQQLVTSGKSSDIISILDNLPNNDSHHNSLKMMLITSLLLNNSNAYEIFNKYKVGFKSIEFIVKLVPIILIKRESILDSKVYINIVLKYIELIDIFPDLKDIIDGYIKALLLLYVIAFEAKYDYPFLSKEAYHLRDFEGHFMVMLFSAFFVKNDWNHFIKIYHEIHNKVSIFNMENSNIIDDSFTICSNSKTTYIINSIHQRIKEQNLSGIDLSEIIYAANVSSYINDGILSFMNNVKEKIDLIFS